MGHVGEHLDIGQVPLAAIFRQTGGNLRLKFTFIWPTSDRSLNVLACSATMAIQAQLGICIVLGRTRFFRVALEKICFALLQAYNAVILERRSALCISYQLC